MGLSGKGMREIITGIGSEAGSLKGELVFHVKHTTLAPVKTPFDADRAALTGAAPRH